MSRKSFLGAMLGCLMATVTAFGAQPEAFKLVPGNSVAVAHVDLKKLWNSEHSKDIRELLKRSGPRAIAELQKRFVPDVTALESVTAFGMVPSRPGMEPEGAFLIALSKPVEEMAFFKSALPQGETVVKSGAKMHIEGPFGLAVLNQGRMIAGGSPELLARLGKETVEASGEFAKFLKEDASQPIRLGVNFNAVPRELTRGSPPPVAALIQGLQFLETGISLEKEQKWTARIVYGEENQAKGAHESIKMLAGMALMQMRLPRQEIENRLFPKNRQGVAPLTELPEFVGAMFGLAMLNEAEALLKNPPITQVGSTLKAEYTFPQISSGTLLPMVGIGTGLMLPAVQKVRAAATRTNSMNNLKQIGLAMHNYLSTYQGFPAAAICDKKTGKPLLSWRVAILPFIEEENLYKQFKQDEPWDSEHNLKLAQKMPRVYFHPNKNKPGDNKTHYRVFFGNGAIFDLNKPCRLRDITDGTSNTILTVEAEEPVIWTKPEELPFDPKMNLPKLLFINGRTNVGLSDGSVRSISGNMKPETLKLLIQRNDGNPIPPLD